MQLDHANIAKAIDFLGIEFPVEVYVEPTIDPFTMGGHYTRVEHPRVALEDNGRMTRGGNLVQADEARWVHIIIIAPDLTPTDAGETLWHELAHAMQFERDCPPAGTVKDTLHSWRTQYDTNRSSHEAEANSYMKHNQGLPLAI